MKNFKEIAEKCLKGELSGTFIIHRQIFAKNDVEILKVPSKNLIINKVYPSFPYLFKSEGVINISCEFIANFNGSGINRLHSYKIINFIPDMKENDKRTIQVSLQEAREWYNSGNDTLRTLALSSFSKEELDPYPRSWIEYLGSYPGHLLSLKAPELICAKLIAYGKLLLLREEWIHIWSQEQGLEKDWEFNCNPNDEKCVIILKVEHFGGIVVEDLYPLSFPTIELAQDFMNTFKDLLEQAKGLY